MKKSLVLAMAMALGVTASAYAANPFSDVPAGHWAYDSISKLAAAGVIEGYGDDTFRGDRLMTRYEMAQIVAKAMAKGANVDKLAAEFANELDALGVRVAALEKKSDNVQITGEVRYHYGHFKYKGDGGDTKAHEHGLRSRLYFTGKVNDNWNYVGRIQNQQWFNDNVENGQTDFNVAKLEGRLGGVNVIAGRDDDVFADGYIYDGGHDAIKLSYGDKWYVSGAFGRITDVNEDDNFWQIETGADFSKRFYTAEIGSKIEDSFVNGKVGYFKAELTDEGKNYADGKNVGIFYVGADFNLAKDLGLNAMYLHANRDKFGGLESKKDGYVVGLGYKGAEASEPGSWGLTARYYHQGRGTYLAHTIDGDTDFVTGFKGWSIGGEVTVAKNMVASVTYYDTKALKGDQEDNAKTKVIWSEFNVTF